jgi:DNA (cytosine-5)-methyltransferase 1
MRLKVLDLFSGIGGFHLGLERAGFEVESYFSEIDKYAIDVYSNNFKNSTYVGSVTDVKQSNLPRIDAITFGSPCQDFSLAGKRKGLDGSRSSLITEAIRLIYECRPSFFIWENVKGTFSSNNREDFAAILQAFANIGGYRLEWQLLNTKWFLPQNRERIYLVGYLRDGSRGQVFPIGESNGAHNELSKQQAHTCTLTTRYGADGNGSYIIERELNAQKIAAMRGRYNDDNKTEQRLEINNEGISNTLTSVTKDNYVIGDFRNDEGYRERLDGNSPTLKSQGQPIVNKIRRLTPIECERLQGFPDNWTKYGKEKGLISDSQRYKMCGNAVTVDVVEAVAKRLKLVL